MDPKLILMGLSLLCLLSGYMATNSILFVQEGQTAVSTSFAHLIVEINTNKVMQTYDNLNDMAMGLIKVDSTMTLESQKKRAKFPLYRLQSKISTLTNILRKAGQEFHRYDGDGVNPFLSALMEVPVKLTVNASTVLSSAIVDNSTTVATRGKRGVIAQIAKHALKVLPAFGASLYSLPQMNAIKQSINPGQVMKVISNKLSTDAIRMNNITNYINNLEAKYISNIHQVKKLITRDVAVKNLKDEVKYLIQMFDNELSDYIQAIDALLNHRLSPLLVSPQVVDQAFTNLMRKAQLMGLHPLSANPGVIYQSTASTVLDGNGNLLVIVHLPLYAGSLMKLYRHVKSPLYLKNGYVLHVNSHFDYLAMDRSGTLAKQFTNDELQHCKFINNIYHCPQKNVLEKDLDSLCLYNLYHQNINRTIETCDVTIAQVTSHVTQLSANMFRILTDKQVTLTRQCKNQQTLTEIIEEQYELELTPECPRASTPTQLFVRSPQMVSSLNMLSLPLKSNTKQWLDWFKSSLKNSEVSFCLQKEQDSQTLQAPLRRFRQCLSQYTTGNVLAVIREHVVTVSSLAVLITLVVILFYLSYHAFKVCLMPCVARICCVRSCPSFRGRHIQNNIYMSPMQHHGLPSNDEDEHLHAGTITPRTLRRMNRYELNKLNLV